MQVLLHNLQSILFESPTQSGKQVMPKTEYNFVHSNINNRLFLTNLKVFSEEYGQYVIIMTYLLSKKQKVLLSLPHFKF